MKLTREDVRDALRKAAMFARSAGTLFARAAEELGEDEHADWREALAGSRLARSDLDRITGSRFVRTSEGETSLHCVEAEMVNRVLDAEEREEAEVV